MALTWGAPGGRQPRRCGDGPAMRIYPSSLRIREPLCLRIVIQIELVAAFAGIRLNKIPRVVDIEHEV